MSVFARVLVGLDLVEDTTNLILTRASQLADADAIEALHVCDHLHHHHEDYNTGQFADSEDLDAAIKREAALRLTRACKPFGINKQTVLGGHATEVIHTQAEQKADLVVIGTHGRHGLRLLLGSTANAVLNGTPCNVLAVRVTKGEESTPSPYQRILVAVDLSDESRQLLDHAKRVAEACGAAINVCHVFKPVHHSYLKGQAWSDKVQAMDTEAKQQTLERLHELGNDYDVATDALFLQEGQPADEIHKLAKQRWADLVVVGTHGKLSGSTANAVLHGAECDALSVRIQRA